MFSIRNNAKLNQIVKNVRNMSKNDEISPIFTNRNPRNLEKMRIAYKPDGYHVEKPGKSFWHKLDITSTGRYAVAKVIHFENGTVIGASTEEWSIKKQLYRTKDASAFINLGRVLAERCLMSGITEIRCDIDPFDKQSNVALFIQAVKDGGVRLEEPKQYKAPFPTDIERPEKPWEVLE